MNPNATITTILVLARWPAASMAWGLKELARGALFRSRVPGLRWRKVLGSGHEGGFGLRPGWDRLAQLCVFDDPTSARDWLAHDPALQTWRERAAELLWLELRAWQSRGHWAGQDLPVSTIEPPAGPVAALTRASIRPARAWAFWSHSPAAERALETSLGCRLAVGLGEAPLLRQATFSLWDDIESMNAYARSGAHLDAIRNAYREGYFSESMFARFAVTDRGGAWSSLVEH
jgi:spheroidene monooxygenase